MIAYRVGCNFLKVEDIYDERFEPWVISGIEVQRAGVPDGCICHREPYKFDTVIIGDHAYDNEFTMISIEGNGSPDIISRCTIRESRKPPKRASWRRQLVIGKSQGKDDEIAMVHTSWFQLEDAVAYVRDCCYRRHVKNNSILASMDDHGVCQECGTVLEQYTRMHPDTGETRSYGNINIGSFIRGVYNWAEGTLGALSHEYLITMKPGASCRLERRGWAFLLTWDGKNLEMAPFDESAAKIVRIPRMY
ncbi:MAG: hypothetical protein WC451_04495 [Patescibacteria group bacterium]